MTRRLAYRSVATGLYDTMARLSGASTKSGFGRQLLALVKIGASETNGCTFCPSVHIQGGRKAGLTDEQIDMVAVWREAVDIFSPGERAALAWTEPSTLLPLGSARRAAPAETCVVREGLCTVDRIPPRRATITAR